MRRLGWAFFAFIVVVLAGYVLNRGIYIGYTMTSYRVGDRTFSLKNCRYLHLNGTDEVSVAGSFTGNTPAETECPPAQKFKVRHTGFLRPYLPWCAGAGGCSALPRVEGLWRGCKGQDRACIGGRGNGPDRAPLPNLETNCENRVLSPRIATPL